MCVDPLARFQSPPTATGVVLGPAVALAVMVATGTGADSAVELTRRIRPIANPNPLVIARAQSALATDMSAAAQGRNPAAGRPAVAHGPLTIGGGVRSGQRSRRGPATVRVTVQARNRWAVCRVRDGALPTPEGQNRRSTGFA